jgi:hypothetical protein
MYELKENGKVFTSKYVGTGPSSYEKKNLTGHGLTKVEKHCSTQCTRPASQLPKTPSSTSSNENHMQ